MNIPATLQAGDTLSWTDSLSDYPATTYTLKYSLRAYGLVIDIPTTASGTDHAVAVTAATSAGYAPGEYEWTAYVETGSGASLVRRTITSGYVTVRPFLHAALSTTDNRSFDEQCLANIKAALLRLVKHEVESLTVNGRTVSFKNIKELEEERDRLERRISGAKGLSSGKLIYTRFGQ